MAYRKLVLICLLLFGGLSSFGQSPLYFTGYGRALVGKSRFDKNSEFVKDDSSSKKQSLDGNFVFDLGANIQANDQFKASAVLRFYNAFGNFYGSGSIMEFRQVQIQAVLAKKVLFHLGDLDMGLTRYTLYNSSDPTYSEFESDAFKIRRDIIHYENFNNGNKWRLQGAQASTNINFNKGIEKISISVLGARTIASNYLSTPDRLLFGGNVKIKQSKFLEIGGNVASLSDVSGTVQDTLVFYQNSVFTGEYKVSLSSRTFNFSTFGEVGRSFYDFNKVAAEERVTTYDGFFDVGASATHRYIPVSLNVGYRLVGPDFSSPGAQTMRMLDYQNGVLLPSGGTDGLIGSAGVLARNQMIFDRMSDLNLYNRSLSTILMTYNPVYNNSTPYGAATPNRKGFSADVKYGNKDSLIYVNVHTELLSEVLGVGISDKRKFTLINPGVTFNVNRLLKTKRLLALSSALRYENTKGSQAIDVNLTSMLLDGSLTVETFKSLDLIGGMKFLQASGTEYLFVRDDFNRITNYQQFTPDVKQVVYSGGIRYRFTNYIFLAANVFMLDNTNNKNSVENYKMNQYFFSYIMKF